MKYVHWNTDDKRKKWVFRGSSRTLSDQELIRGNEERGDRTFEECKNSKKVSTNCLSSAYRSEIILPYSG
jgi:hypothetical protein